jgi:hypothetical protein
MMLRRHALVAAAVLAVLPAWAWAALPPAERARIERLLGYVEARKDVTFMRNRTGYSSSEAARFLRAKLDKMGEHVTNAQQFIEQIASRSSTSGQPYLVRFADGRTETTAAFLAAELRRVDSRQ